jgi:hypothetical protein
VANRAFSAALVPFPLLLGLIGLTSAVHAQELPLEHCDKLPVLEVVVGAQPMWFLVDTAATSMLNLKSFTEGRARDIRVTSWRGTLATSALEVTLADVVIGSTKLVGLKLPAIDLSAVGNACGRKIDGILGVDLLGRLGVTIDLKKQTIHVATQNDERAAEIATEMHLAMQRCLKAFNSSDERTFAGCLDPKIVLFTSNSELYGREQALGYFRERYFHQKPTTRLEIRQSAFHVIGEAVWYEYELIIEWGQSVLHVRGMAMCHKTDGHWRLASMQNSVVQAKPSLVSK